MQWGQAIFEISLEMFKNSSRTGKSFSEVVVCQNFFECQNKTKTTICVHNMFCKEFCNRGRGLSAAIGDCKPLHYNKLP